ncbi:MAG TPA: glucoamylase family protein [Gemmataceae bacterium]|nr:glucoamylase family protein [Gemmataceae bacterium]
MPALERWKILDNLRRSLIAPVLVIWLLLGWLLLPGLGFGPLGLAVLVLALPALLLLFGAAYHTIQTGSTAPIAELRETLPATLAQTGLSFCFLLYEACLSFDAVVRTLVRLFVTRRRLLEWETSACTERRLGVGVQDFLRTMGLAPVLTAGVVVLLAAVHPAALTAAWIFLIPWFGSPFVAYWVSQTPRVAATPLTVKERRQLRRIARKTWGFFETFVGDEDHWLPPDNHQEEPHGATAHRTSPTNIGLCLVSTLAAHDFGYIGLSDLVDRLERTFKTLEKLERYRGHFLNWYDTVALKPLAPAYVSTVDSGNLMACLVVVKQGLQEKIHEPVLEPALAAGLADTLSLVAETLRELGRPSAAEAARCHDELETTINDISLQLDTAPGDLPGWNAWLDRLDQQTESLTAGVRCLGDLAREAESRPGSLAAWVEQLTQQVRAVRAEMERLALRVAPAEAAVSRPWKQVPRLIDFDGADDAPSRGVGAELLRRCRELAGRAEDLVRAMDLRFLYLPDRRLFSIGFRVPQERLDPACYDLLASEARLASFLAVARDDVPRRHWFQLGRATTRLDGRPCLLSWGGTMFEYLMPPLLMRSYPGTLLTESDEAALDMQRRYGRRRGVPWGISESAYSSQYANMDYQYQAFGVPGLGLKRGLGQDLVIAPYATALAAPVQPRAAASNFSRLAAEGADGLYGCYEAVDFTRDRLPEGKRSLVVRCFMAHHQGMSLIALANCLLGEPMPRRFHAEPMVRSAELLLQERVPHAAPNVQPPEVEAPLRPARQEESGAVRRRLTTPFTPGPRTHLLSNGRYAVMTTNAGGGWSRCGDLDVTRWREDFTRDACGQFCYIRDLTSGLLWSATHHPVGRLTDYYEVLYSADKAEYRRGDGSIATSLEIAVSPQDAAEVRRVTITNHDSKAHELELTSYAEVVLAPHGADLAHPAFGKLFLETEWLPTHQALFCRRRPRAPEQSPVWGVHVAAVDGPIVGEIQYETDRERFLGRGRIPASPRALAPGANLTGTVGPVLDPIFSLRLRIHVAPGSSASVAFTTAAAKNREEALILADHYRDYQAVVRAFDLAWAHCQVELRHLRLSTEEAHLYQRLAAHLIYAGPALRAPSAVLAANAEGQPALWRFGVSGDRPILLVTVAEPEEIPLIRRVLAAHAYWRLKSLEVDLVLLNERPSSYFEGLHQQLSEALRTSDSRDLLGKPGGVFLLKADHLTPEDRTLLRASARVELAGHRGTLAAQAARVEPAVTLPEPLPVKKRKAGRPERVAAALQVPPGLLFFNGLGGFTPDGREYVIGVRGPDGLPPVPWVNVIANASFGCLVSESGLGCAWSGNSQLHRLTPWNNDPVSDPPGQVVYLRDEATGEFWTPTPRPAGASAPTVVRHGQGYTSFTRNSHGLAQELTVLVAPDDPVQLMILRLRNTGGGPRRLSAVLYAEWVLGTTRDQAPLSVCTEVEPETGALLARNAFQPDFRQQTAFAYTARPQSVAGDRTEFLGRNGAVENPAALARVGMSGRTGGGLDPCAAIQTVINLNAGEEREVVFLLGGAPGPEAVRNLVRKYGDGEAARKVLADVKARWDKMLGAVQVQTPDPALDLLVNRWLLYQVLSCRVWGRTAFYQSSGAYGFRDQLQDVTALVYAAPEEARAQLLRAAARQFLEGDVQHWWHPSTGQGVRTRFSDDFLWLPFTVCHYVRVTGDAAVLDENIGYLRAPKLQPGEQEEYSSPARADESGSLYDHCVRALRNGLRKGAHGLPLMGGGDWNDGMNRIGVGGKGESVWDAWFLTYCLRSFAELAESRSDAAWAASCRQEAEQLRQAVEQHGWDGAWYLRAYFDDGTPLGSAQNDECQIDSIVQTWAVLSGAAEPERAARAMASLQERLVRRDPGLVLLFTPPFDDGRLQPGYIKGYVPGVRENGGQYTHAAAWVVQAAALLGQGDQAAELFGLINPVRHAASPEGVARYRTEPYVLAGDVYAEPPHAGRGGWTWYTGSAAWLYRAALESMLGFRLRGGRLSLTPSIPKAWPSFQITLQYRSATYQIAVVNGKLGHGQETMPQPGAAGMMVDGQPAPSGEIALEDDGRRHEIHIVLR